MRGASVLIVDDEDLIRWSLSQRMTDEGCRVAEAGTGAEALEKLGEAPDLVLLDFRLPDADGLSLLRRIKERSPDTVVIMMTGYSTVEHAVEAMRAGAYHYVNKPVNLDEMMLLAEKALETKSLRSEVRALRADLSAEWSFDRIVGESRPMREVKALLGRIAASPASTVLITGESGTGKDLAAKALHHHSDRAQAAFTNITCSALPEPLLESELFGHEKGAFTDARAQKKGLLETADHGTVFLDEIGEMSPVLQAKLLRFLEEKAFRRVGGNSDIRVDVRVIAATNRDLSEEVRAGRFREDLYYRLHVMPVRLPPLRERREDIPLLVDYYIERFNREFRREVLGVEKEAASMLEAYAWPGNVRELRNAVERAMLLCETKRLSRGDFLMPAEKSGSAGASDFRLPEEGLHFDEVERSLVRQALERAGGNQTQAAALLGMNRDQIRYRIEKFGLGDAKTRRRERSSS